MASDDGEEDESFYDARDDTIIAIAYSEERAEADAVAEDKEALVSASEMIGHSPAAGQESATTEESQRARSRSRSTATATATATSPRTASRSSSRSHHRFSLPAFTLEPVPTIPAKFLDAGRPSLVQQRSSDAYDRARPASLHIHTDRDATDATAPRQQGSHEEIARGRPSDAQRERSVSRFSRRKSLPARSPHLHASTLEKLESKDGKGSMETPGQRKNEDLFLELAAGDEDARPRSRGERALSRLSSVGKRRSMPSNEHTLPSPADRRPKSSGQAFANRPSSRLDALQTNVQRVQGRLRNTPSRATYQGDDTASLSGRSQSGRAQRWSSIADRSPASPSLRERLTSPDSTQFGRRRPSFGGAPFQPPKTRPSRLPGSFDEHSESPEENSENKQSQDSTDADSQTADTVWDELDDLKSRIKKLELTGKLPPSSGAAASSNETSERPRTATTAPTTIDSSPKRAEQKMNAAASPTAGGAAVEYTVGGPNVSNIHPLLHSALAKAKPLLNANLYRTLEATASDALQLAAMTGGAGPQGTAFSAAAIINGATVSDRHVRRKADTMCRNLTDLCLALCDGKLDAGSTVASPVAVSTPLRSSPSIRPSRSSLGPNEGLRNTSRPMSRLEARRTSILGAGSSFGASPSPHRRESDDVSASEAEHTPSHPAPAQDFTTRRSGSRLQVQRQHFDDVSGDEDPTIRPISRAMTDSFRTRRDYSATSGAHRSPSLRDSLVARRANAAGFEENEAKVQRVLSLTSDNGSRRRFGEHATPPVMEEEDGGEEGYEEGSSSVAPKRRVTSYGFGGRERGAGRATSLGQSRRQHVVVE